MLVSTPRTSSLSLAAIDLSCHSPGAMPFHWLKSLSCKSNALDDIVHLPNQRQPSSSRNPSLSYCSSTQIFLHVIILFAKTRQIASQNPPQNPSQTIPQTSNPNLSPKRKPISYHKIPPFHPLPHPSRQSPSPPLPILSKLPVAHSSRRIIEIIFRTSWTPSNAPFPDHIDMLFRIRHSPLAIAAFEACRAAVRRANSDNSRCAADGNEMMRFHSPAADVGFYNGGVERSKVGMVEGVRTFAGSGAAHDRCGCVSVRRRMLVCRVIVGRVGDPEEMGSGVDSVRDGEDEILVLDSRAVLPCFLIIYNV